MTHKSKSAPNNRANKLKRDQKQKADTINILLTILGVLSALMLGISLSILSPETGPLANLKVLLVTCSAGLVTYSINRFAIEQGTALAAIGYHWAGIISVVSILVAGSGMFIGAYSGLVYKAVDERSLQANGTALVAYLSNINRTSLDAGRADPALRLVADDLANYAECEKKSSCISLNGAGGFGPVAAQISRLSKRSIGIASAFEQGKLERKRLLPRINKLNTRYQKTLGDIDKDIAKRRAHLQATHSEIEQAAMALSETLPVSLLRTYTEELLSGVTIAGQRGTTQRLNEILRQHGEALSNIIEKLDNEGHNAIAPPIFPAPSGMLDSLKYVAEFAAFAAVIFVAELILPITLWMLTYFKLAWEIERRTPTKPDNSDKGFGELIDLTDPAHSVKKLKVPTRAGL